VHGHSKRTQLVTNLTCSFKSAVVRRGRNHIGLSIGLDATCEEDRVVSSTLHGGLRRNDQIKLMRIRRVWLGESRRRK
jgi:hypothetical protein